MPRKQWTRIEELIDRFDKLPDDQRSDELELLTENGESTEVISYLRLNYKLKPNLKVISLGQKIGDKYTLTEKIAAGGMGVVYRARQDLVDREVAVKMIHPALANPKMFAKLKDEIATLGRLQHVGIVHIFDADIHYFDSEGKQGAVFYTMELVEGPTMRKWMKEEKPSYEQKLEFFAHVCDAVAYAHQKGVIHRDLKPENILVRPGLMPAVLDFGLSRVMSEVAPVGVEGASNPSKTPEMEMSGTPAYMSLEKWAQSGDDHRGDLYALGVIFHELLWGSRPLEFDTCDCFEDMKEAALDWTFQGITKEQREGIDEPVLGIIPRLLAKEPDNRPQNAGEVAGVIRALLEKRQRMRRFKKRAPYLIGIAALIVVTLFWSLKTSDYMRRMEKSRNTLAEARQLLRDRSARAPSKALGMIPSSPKDRHSEDEWKKLAVEAMTSWEIVSLQEPVQNCEEILGFAEDGRRYFGIDLTGQYALFDSGKVMTLGNAQAEPVAFCIHPEQSMVALSDHSGGIHIFTEKNGHVALGNKTPAIPTTLTFSPDGDSLAFATQPPPDPEGLRLISGELENDLSSEIIIYHTRNWTPKEIVFRNNSSLDYLPKLNPALKTITGLAFSPDSSSLASWSSVDSGMVLIWDTVSGSLVEGFYCGGPVLKASWSHSGRDMLCVRQDGMGYLWESRHWQGYERKKPLSEGTRLYNLSHSNVESIGWLPDDTGIAWQDAFQPKVNVRQIHNNHTVALEGEFKELALKWNDATSAWIYFEGHQVYRWQFQSKAHRAVMVSLTENASFAFVPNTTLLALADLQGVIMLDYRSFDFVDQFEMPLSGPVKAPSGTDQVWLFSKWAGPVGFDVEVSKGSDMIRLKEYCQQGIEAHGVFAFQDKARMVAFTAGNSLFIKDPLSYQISANKTEEDGQEFDVPDYSVPIRPDCQFLEFSRDGKWLVAGSTIASWLSLWQFDQGRWVDRLIRSRSGIPLFPRNNSTQLLVAESDQIVVHGLNGSRAEYVVSDGLDQVTAMAQCPQNSLLAIGDSHGVSVKAGDSELTHVFDLPVQFGRTGVIRSLGFSPDGSILVALVKSETNSNIHVWNIEKMMADMETLRLHSIEWHYGDVGGQPGISDVRFIHNIHKRIE